ncbi:hypothetical protein BU104_13440, partial [Staphylococcus xylosus]
FRTCLNAQKQKNYWITVIRLYHFIFGLTLIVSRIAWRNGKPTHSFSSVKGWIYAFHTWGCDKSTE